jgi:uncharacterized membrane protein YfcA
MPGHFLALIACVFAAALLRGFTGFGFAAAAVPMLSLLMPPAQVVPLVLLLQTAVGLPDLRAAARLCDWRSIRWLVVGMIVGTPAGLVVLHALSPATARLAIGLLLAAGVLMLAFGRRISEPVSRPTTIAVGLASGIMNGLAAIPGPPVVAFFLAMPHPAGVVRASSIVFFAMTSATALAPLALHGAVGRTELIWAALALPCLFGGSRLGARFFHHARPQHHRWTALAVLGALAVLLIARALSG